MNWLGRIIQDEVKPNDTVLDLGCGIMQATTDILNKVRFPSIRYFFDLINYQMQNSSKGNLKCKSILGLDIWDKYLKLVSKKYPTIKLSMNELDRFVDDSYDVVICLDVLEHLELSEAIAAIDNMKRIARKKVIVYTPSKYVTNEEHVYDSWNMGVNQYQSHKSIITSYFLHSIGFKVSFPEPDKNTLGVYIRDHF